MKLPVDLFDKKELGLLKEAKIDVDFDKDYSLEELGDLEIELKDACLDYGFTDCKPNEKCDIWEKICDDFVAFTDSL